MTRSQPPCSLLDHFSALKDPRERWRVQYPLDEILLVVLCATLSGMEDGTVGYFVLEACSFID